MRQTLITILTLVATQAAYGQQPARPPTKQQQQPTIIVNPPSPEEVEVHHLKFRATVAGLRAMDAMRIAGISANDRLCIRNHVTHAEPDAMKLASPQGKAMLNSVWIRSWVTAQNAYDKKMAERKATEEKKDAAKAKAEANSAAKAAREERAAEERREERERAREESRERAKEQAKARRPNR